MLEIKTQKSFDIEKLAALSAEAYAYTCDKNRKAKKICEIYQ